MENGKNLIHSFNHSEKVEGNFQGLTKREYFAGLAMQGLLSNPEFVASGSFDYKSREKEKQLAKIALLQTDALLKQLGNE